MNKLEFAKDGMSINSTEEKTLLMSLALEYMNMGRTSFSYIKSQSEISNKTKKYLMIGDLLFSVGAVSASKTKNLPFYKLFSKQCIDSSNVMTTFQEYNKHFPAQSIF